MDTGFSVCFVRWGTWFRGTGVACVALLLVLAGWPGASAGAQDAATGVEVVITFPTTPEVALKMKTGRYVRGKLISLGQFEAVVETDPLNSRDRERGDRQARIASDKFESLRTSNGQLVYLPETDDFAVIAATVRAKFATAKFSNDPDAGVPGESPGSNLPGAQPTPTTTQPPPREKPAVHIGNGGFGGLSGVPRKSETPAEKPVASSADAPEASSEATTPIVGDAAEVGSEMLICSSCNKAITSAQQTLAACPHCGITWLTAPAAGSPSHRLPGAHGANPLPAPTVNTAPISNPGAQSQATVVQPLGPGAAPTVSPGFHIDTIPAWAKACVFAVLLLVVYHIFFRG
ncbi:MAG: hypothetical protein DWH91_19885 [Planctomycetota bacterium]|nr:MAG: hypothetical protein DWH91_19885 [Planctomycetota bacterium]